MNILLDDTESKIVVNGRMSISYLEWENVKTNLKRRKHKHLKAPKLDSRVAKAYYEFVRDRSAIDTLFAVVGGI